MPLSFNYRPRFVCDLVTQWRNVHVPPVALCSHVTPKDNRVTPLYIQWTALSATVERNSSVHACHSSVLAHGAKFGGGNFKHFKISVGRTRYIKGSSPLTCKFANGCLVLTQGQGGFIKRGLPREKPSVV